MPIDTDRYRARPGAPVELATVDPEPPATGADRAAYERALRADLAGLAEWQRRLRAAERHGLLIILMAADTGGKDPTIREVFGALDPRGLAVAKFGAPSATERRHDFLRRVHAAAPGRGEIAVFNRSHYDDIVEPRLRGELDGDARQGHYAHTRHFEELLSGSGIAIRKFYFHISRDEQARGVLARLEDPEQQHEFDPDDIAVQEQWDAYLAAYEEVVNATTTERAPWYVVPANRPWFRNATVARVVAEALEQLDPQFPAPLPAEEVQRYKAALARARR